MKLNKTILVGALFILLAGVIFLTDILNPIIRPVTYLFLMGSSKGKDIIFFGLLGLFLILSQVIKKEIDTTKYLKISMIIGGVLLILGILLEVILKINPKVRPEIPEIPSFLFNTIFNSLNAGFYFWNHST